MSNRLVSLATGLLMLGTTVMLPGCIVKRPRTTCDRDCCGCDDTTPTIQPVCRDGDMQNRADRPAMIQASSPEATLIINIDKGRKAIPLSDLELDALECSIMHYREVHGYGHRYKERRTYQQLTSQRYWK